MRLLAWIASISLGILMIWVIWGGHWADWTDVRAVSVIMQSYGVSAGLAGVILLILDLVFPIPNTVVMSALGYLYGIGSGAALGFLGSLCAGMIGYGIGRLCPEKFSRRFLGEKDFQRGRRLCTRGGGWVIALSRAVPILPEALSVTAGLLRMPCSAFFLSMSCGSLPMAVLFSWIGATGHDRPLLTLVLSFSVPAVLWSLASLWQRRAD